MTLTQVLRIILCYMSMHSVVVACLGFVRNIALESTCSSTTKTPLILPCYNLGIHTESCAGPHLMMAPSSQISIRTCLYLGYVYNFSLSLSLLLSRSYRHTLFYKLFALFLGLVIAYSLSLGCSTLIALYFCGLFQRHCFPQTDRPCHSSTISSTSTRC